MRYFMGSYEDDSGQRAEGLSVHALAEDSLEIHTYIQELRTWNVDRHAASHFFFPELHHSTSRITFNEITRDEAYPALARVPRFDRREEVQRRLSARARGQLRRSGKVLTSAEVGLLTKPLKQRVSMNPAVKDLIEVRSRYRRWTALILQEEGGPARRQAVKTLRENEHLRHNSVGEPLGVRHAPRSFLIDGETQRYVAIEVKYLRETEQAVEGARR